MFISSDCFYNYLEKSNNRLCSFIFYIVDMPRQSDEKLAKYAVFGEAIGSIPDANFPHDFAVITNNTEWQKYYTLIRKNYYKTDFIKDFYYIRNKNWCEIGYFLMAPGKKTARVSYYVWFSSSAKDLTTDWTSDWEGVTLNKSEFYKTNTIFKEGLFNKE